MYSVAKTLTDPGGRGVIVRGVREFHEPMGKQTREFAKRFGCSALIDHEPQTVPPDPRGVTLDHPERGHDRERRRSSDQGRPIGRLESRIMDTARYGRVRSS